MASNKKNLSRERSLPDTRRRTHFPAMANRIEFKSQTEKEKIEKSMEAIRRRREVLLKRNQIQNPKLLQHTHPESV